MRAAAFITSVLNNDVDVQSWATRRASAGIPVVAGERKRSNDFLRASKMAGLFDYQQIENLGEGDSLAASLMPLVAKVGASTHTAVNFTAAQWDQYLGWQSDGASNYIQTGIVMGVTPFNPTVGFGYYLRTPQGSNATTRTLMGCSNSGGTGVYWSAANISATGAALAGAQTSWLSGNLAAGAIQTGITGGAQGQWDASRISGTNLLQYLNGINLGGSASARAIVSSVVGLTVLCISQNTTFGSFPLSGTRISAYGLYAGMITAQIAARAALIQAHEASLGRNVT